MDIDLKKKNELEKLEPSVQIKKLESSLLKATTLIVIIIRWTRSLDWKEGNNLGTQGSRESR